MFTHAIIIAQKDIKLLFSRGIGVIQALLLGLLLIFIFSLSKPLDENITAQAAATIFWLASIFCQVLTFNILYHIEKKSDTWSGLLLTPCPVQAIWLGKALTGFIIISVAQLIFIPAIVVFLNQEPGICWAQSLLIIFLINIGLVSIGSLIGGLSQGQSTQESLISIILFPLVVPLLLAGIHTCTDALSSESTEAMYSWMHIVIAFDAIFAASALALFPVISLGDE
ncbi:heme exporter protein CcmB [Lawsonia intracellularis]|uniref:ABC-type transport system involved in cytochrome c biogenesis, permease component n=1 Tax=Lawsonia intracellularis (strain PHE/MN1-00) TaxID=363253 RepID=Q1MPR9_LAWIP|nr:heme exporter protein CcmB [Lawsonia intracellularis]AGC50382.1 cytochrome c-biogenesis protein CcmB [Lawsonia intracellularis N343]KAA0204405.1 heme ABC transporter permease CcmB [Lawsonia intracellularis]MBZ3892829.1 heme exporter protein CcmB [Lawsonia intracellularis]OMQ02852.1 heme ABC transporter permease CcmB [Lawsonia intracellularis]RBN33010.1 heme ABC transporter permease CcmB [Lawsonia intracellularis]